MIWDFLQTFSDVRNKQKLFADDTVSKLNRTTTVGLMITVAIFMTAKGFNADQIECNGEKNQLTVTASYVQSICWVKDIFEADNFNSQHPSEGKGFRFNFYPWLPVITLLLATCYYIPYMLWKLILKNSMYQHMPIDIDGIVNILKEVTVFDKESFNSNIELVSSYLHKSFTLNNFEDSYETDSMDDIERCSNHKKVLVNQPRTFYSRVKAKKFFVPVFVSFMLIKVLYLVVSFGIFALIDVIFRFEKSFYFFGYNMIHSMFYTKESELETAYLNSSYFPRVVFCLVHTKEDMNNRYVGTPYQCVLPANFLNEKIFIGLWLWFYIIAFINFCSLVRWTYVFMTRKWVIKEMLSWPFDNEYHFDRYLKPFVKNYLRTEGVLVLMLIKSNTQDWHCRMIVNHLWKNYLKSMDSDLINESKETFFVNNDFTLNKKSPISAPTAKCENRRKLDMDCEDMQKNISNITDL